MFESLAKEDDDIARQKEIVIVQAFLRHLVDVFSILFLGW